MQAMHEAASALSAGQLKQVSMATPPPASPGSEVDSGSPLSMWWQSTRVSHKHAARTSPDLRAFGSDIEGCGENVSPNAAVIPSEAHAHSGPAASQWHRTAGGGALEPLKPQRPADASSEAGSPSAQRQYGSSGWQGFHAPPHSKDTCPDAPRKVARRMQRLGELLAIVRPLLYVALLRRYGCRSWIPWSAALACEALSHVFTSIGSRQMRQVCDCFSCPPAVCAICQPSIPGAS
jgi:Peroxisomal membrane protein (Pex16)